MTEGEGVLAILALGLAIVAAMIVFVEAIFNIKTKNKKNSTND